MYSSNAAEGILPDMTPTGLKTLPNDVTQCHHLIAHLDAINREQARTIEEEQCLRARLQQQVELLLKRLYGPRAERIDPKQLALFAQ